MRVAFIVNKFPRLSETFILNQITGLLDRGIDVDIYAKSPGNDSKIHPDVEKYNLLNRTFYQRIPTNKFIRFLKGLMLIIIHFHKKPVVLLKLLNVFKFKKEAASLSTVYKVIPFLNNRPYDIVHCHFGPNGNLGILLKEVGVFKGKVITSFHGYDVSTNIKKHGDNIYDRLFEKGDLFLPISERWKEELIKLGCSKQKVIVHRMGVDINKFKFSQRELEKNGKIHLLTIARFVEKKGLSYGVRAVAKVLKKHPDLEYKIVGDGPLKRDVESLIRELNISENVKLVGWKQQEDIIELMKDADILLAPSVTGYDGDQEGIPVVLMEALAQGLPVISTYHSGIPELVQDGISGLLVPERDVGALEAKLMYLINHQEIYSKMGSAGREYIEKNYNITKLNEQLVELYRQLLDGK